MPRTVKIVPQKPLLAQQTKVAAYARVSSGKDAMLHSMSAQVSYYSRLIQGHEGWLYVGVYADEAITGTKDRRDDFQRLIGDCHAGKVNMIITKSISRFARNTVTLLETVRELKALGVDIYFEEQNIHTMSADGELMLTILASYAQEESLSASENQKWRIRKNFEEGKPWDCTMLGYRAKNGVFEIVPEEAETVKLIFSLYLDGYGKQAIANRLNELGIPTRMNKTWSPSTIGKMLCNERYAGDLLLQKTFRTDHLTKRTQVNRGELPMYQVQGAHEPIIDRAAFDAVQAEIARRSKMAPANAGSFTSFTGKMRCGICGKNYRRKTTHTGIVWICATFNSRGKKQCASKQVPEDTLKAVCADVLGLSEFDSTVFDAKVKRIEVPENNSLRFVFKDGSTVLRTWAGRSRRESWTKEMRKAAAEKRMQRGKTRCQEQ